MIDLERNLAEATRKATAADIMVIGTARCITAHRRRGATRDIIDLLLAVLDTAIDEQRQANANLLDALTATESAHRDREQRRAS